MGNNTTVRLTMAQAIVRFLDVQYTERDGVEHKFFAGCFGIFGHGNVAGMGQALQQYPDFRYYQTRNEQAMVHTAAAFAKHSNRLRTLACTSSIGPGATNMVTAAAGATINRVPVLLLPGDIFARRNTAPLLQQVEFEHSQDISVNDCFKPVSRYWDRIYRPGADHHGAARGHARAHQPGRHRRGHALPAPGCAGRGLRLSGRAFREAGLARAPQSTRSDAAWRRLSNGSRTPSRP